MHRICIAPLLLAVLMALSSPAAAACAPADITSITTTSAALAPYNPFTSFSPRIVTVSVVAAKACAIELAFLSPTAPAQMSGAGTLAYDVQATIGGASLLFQGGSPINTAHIDVPGGATAGTANVQIVVPAAQIVANGLYADAGLTLQAFDKTGVIYSLLKSTSLSVTGSVAKVCQFTLPQSPTLNFSSAISNGMANSAVVQSVTFNGVSCTAPTVVQLGGGPMQSPDAPSAAAGLDNFINYRATATFSSATTTLDTSAQTLSTSAGQSTAGGATTDGVLTVNVNLLTGRLLQAGRYQTTLTVTIDPTL